MKTALFALCLFSTGLARAQEAPRGSTTVLVHSPDSARVAYARVVRALVAAGYGVATNDAAAGYARTPPKPLDGALTLTLSAAAVPAPSGGSDVSVSGVFTWFNALSIMAQSQTQQMPVHNSGGTNTPSRRCWNEMVRVAGLMAPGAPLAYR